MKRSAIVAGLTGAAAGGAWVLIEGAGVPPVLLVLAHAVAGLLVVAALRLVGRPLARPLPAAMAVGLALVVLPASLAPFYHAALLWGVRGLVVDLVGAAVAALLGAGVGLGLLRGGWWRPASALALAVTLTVPVLVTRAFAVPQVAVTGLARAVVGDFPTRPVAVVGFDGGDWRVAAPLMAAGRMPNLARIVRDGQHGVLRSIEPIKSPVVWNSIFTGQPPAVHGIHDWYDADTRNLRAAPLWDIVAAHGGRALAVNVPGSWPPEQRAGVAVVAGVPAPGLDASGMSLPVGEVVSPRPEEGPVPTTQLVSTEKDAFTFELLVGTPFEEGGGPWLRSVLVDLAAKKLWFGRLYTRVTVRRRDAGVELSGPAFATPVILPRDGRPTWFEAVVAGTHVVMLGSVLPEAAAGPRFYLSQAMVAPWAPRPPFAAGLPAELFKPRDPPYVVEGPGWVASADPRLVGLVPDLLLDVAERHVDLTVAAVKRMQPQLVCAVVTVTDRMQHAYLPAREDPSMASPALAGRDPVAEAYELADRALGRIVAAMPPDALVFVVSDHGFEVLPHATKGSHRLAGMWAAAGPEVAAAGAPRELGVLDVLPTILACLGAPPAADLPGAAAAGLCPGVVALPPVSSYLAPGGVAAPQQRIDPSREQQIRSLGYIE